MTTLFTNRAIIVVRASDRDQANQDALVYDPEGGSLTFRVGLSPTGALPITHYWASTACRAQVWEAFQSFEAHQATLGNARTRWLFDGLLVEPDDVLDALGLQRIVVED